MPIIKVPISSNLWRGGKKPVKTGDVISPNPNSVTCLGDRGAFVFASQHACYAKIYPAQKTMGLAPWL